MKSATKAALMSGLIFPGAGHLYLKKYITAIVLAGVSFTCISLIMSAAMETAQQLVTQLQHGSAQVDLSTIIATTSAQTASDSGYSLDTLSTIFGIFWLIGIFDSFRVGKVLDKENLLADEQN